MYKSILSIWAIFSSILTFAQMPDYKLTSVDDEFSIYVKREERGVVANITFKHPENYAHVVLERLMGEPPQYRQCAYIDEKMLKAAKDGLITTIDLHPSKAIDDSFYRLRTVGVESIERVYPALRLPAGKPAKALSEN